MSRNTTSRRKVLAIAGTGLAGSLAGCIFGGDDDSGGSPREELSADKKHTVVATDEAISARIKSVEHDPTEQTATVVGAIDVAHEQEYRIRIGVIDAEGMALSETIDTKTLYNVGTNSHRVEFDDIPECDTCHSGLLHVSYPEGENPTVPNKDETAASSGGGGQ